jgi:hypothetical protein
MPARLQTHSSTPSLANGRYGWQPSDSRGGESSAQIAEQLRCTLRPDVHTTKVSESAQRRSV